MLWRISPNLSARATTFSSVKGVKLEHEGVAKGPLNVPPAAVHHAAERGLVGTDSSHGLMFIGSGSWFLQTTRPAGSSSTQSSAVANAAGALKAKKREIGSSKSRKPLPLTDGVFICALLPRPQVPGTLASSCRQPAL